MRVLVAGAGGVIGRRLLPILKAAGHDVAGTSRSERGAAAIASLGAIGVVADAFDPVSLDTVMRGVSPDAVVHQMTSIPARIRPRSVERDFAENDRLRVEGTANLVAAAQRAGVSTIVAQSIAFAYAPGPPGTIHGEDDPLDVAEAGGTRTIAAVASLESTVLEAGGTVLRYGYFYGPGTAIAPDGSIGVDVARRRLPIVGSGTGVWSLIHIDDAARATVLALSGPAGIYNIVDAHPASVAEWLPELARALEAPAPRRVPVWLARAAVGEFGVRMMTSAQGASAARARAELGFAPQFPDWREGFAQGLA